MPRLPRFDEPGAWFHVGNRSIARRPAFETREDIRYFLSRVAHAVRRGEILVHTYCVMTTHFHLVVMSPTGQLSEAMRRIQNEYVRYFNRGRRRDGPLFRGRFWSRRIRSLIYTRILVRYVDENPVKARLVRVPWAYPWGSAQAFQSGRIPKWLCPTWVMQRVIEARETDPQADYASVWGRPLSSAERELVETRMSGPAIPEDDLGDLDDLLGAAPAQIRGWMERKARLADGTKPGLAMAPPSVVVHVVEDLRSRGRRLPWTAKNGRVREAWGIALAGLLHDLAGQSQTAVAARLEVSTTAVARRLQGHAQLMAGPEYATRVGRVASLCLRRALRSGRRSV